VLEGVEACDDGNTVDADTCSNVCTANSTCASGMTCTQPTDCNMGSDCVDGCCVDSCQPNGKTSCSTGGPGGSPGCPQGESCEFGCCTKTAVSGPCPVTLPGNYPGAACDASLGLFGNPGCQAFEVCTQVDPSGGPSCCQP
jgi:hypothetical protein